MSAATLEWSYNPWRDRPRRAALALGAALLCCGVAVSLHLPVLLTLALCAICVSSLASAFVPMRCRLDHEGVVVHSGWVAERRPWTRLQRAVRGRNGVLLSPYRRRHWLDSYRALFLPLPHGVGAPDPDVLERWLAAHGL